MVHKLTEKSEQVITYNGLESEIKLIRLGVPQGSLSGLQLFLIGTNDLASVFKHTVSILFADDSSIPRWKQSENSDQQINSGFAEMVEKLK